MDNIEDIENMTVESIKKVSLEKNDILVIECDTELDEITYKRMKDILKKITNHEKIIILEKAKVGGIIKAPKDKRC